MAKKIGILIAEDHSIVREGMRALISAVPDIEILEEVTNGIEAVESALRLKPDVILMDLVMPRMSGIEAIEQIKQANPDARILVLTSFSEDDKVLPAIRAGAMGYLLKDSSSDILIQSIRDVAQDVPALDSHIVHRLMREFKQPAEDTSNEKIELTEREIEILRLIAQGMSNREIGRHLVISEQTVRAYVSHILAVLHVENRTQAALYALRKGIAQL